LLSVIDNRRVTQLTAGKAEMIDPETLRQLLGPLGQEALAVAEAAELSEDDFLLVFQWLARRFPATIARAAVERAILRRRARIKFSCADRMYFTREALEQATSEPLAQYRATRSYGFRYIFECTEETTLEE